MIKLEIVKIEGCDYYLRDNHSNQHIIKFELIGKEYVLSKNDTLYISEKLLNKETEEFIGFYCFGPINGKHSKKITPSQTDELMVIKHNNKTIYLQRYYG